MNLLTVNSVSKTFNIESGIFRKKTGVVRALDNASITLEKGEVLGIVGESGSGKTTLGKIIARLLSPDSGQILIEGREIGLYSRPEFAAKVQMIFQDPFSSLNPKLSIGAILYEAAGYLKQEERFKMISETLELAGLSQNIMQSYPHQFSGGQRQRIAISRALIRRPQIIIADEPLSSLDVSIQNQLLKIFIKLKDMHSISFIFISHDLAVTSNIADNIVVMKEGRIVEQGTVDKVILHPENEYTQKLLSAVPVF